MPNDDGWWNRDLSDDELRRLLDAIKADGDRVEDEWEQDRIWHNRSLAAVIAAGWIGLLLGYLATSGISDTVWDGAAGFALISGVICAGLYGAVREAEG